MDRCTINQPSLKPFLFASNRSRFLLFFSFCMDILSHFSNHFVDLYFDFSPLSIFQPCKFFGIRMGKKTRWFLRKKISKSLRHDNNAVEIENEQKKVFFFLGFAFYVYACDDIIMILNWDRVKKKKIECFYRHLASILLSSTALNV